MQVMSEQQYKSDLDAVLGAVREVKAGCPSEVCSLYTKLARQKIDTARNVGYDAMAAQYVVLLRQEGLDL